jgi:hypothetical protein
METVETISVACPICGVRIALLLKQAKGVQVATKMHACERDGQKYSTYFRWSKYETGDTNTVSVLSESEDKSDNISALTEWRER